MNETTDTQKECSGCHQMFDITFFRQRKDRPGKRYAKCPTCLTIWKRERAKAHYERNQENCIKRARQYREENPDRVAKSVRKYNAKPEVIERKRAYMKTYKRDWRKYVKDACERCGFVPEDLRQLDVHHIDENKKNNSPNNLMTLCANCHRIVKHIPPRLKPKH